MATTTSDMKSGDMTDAGTMHEKVAGEAKVTASKGTNAGAGPRQDPRQPGGTKQTSNPHLVKQHGFMNHKTTGRK